MKSPREPVAVGDAFEGKRRPDAHDRHEAEHHEQQQLCLSSYALGDTALGFHDEPGSAEQGIARRQSEPAQDCERCPPVESTACKRAVIYVDDCRF